MAECIPHYDDGPVSMTTGATVVGGQLVMVSAGMTVIPATAGSQKVMGVAGRDAVSGAQTPVYFEGVFDLIAAGAVSAGDLVVVGAVAGTVSPAAAVTTPTAGDVNTTRAVVGLALEAIADTATGRVQLRLS